MIDWITQNIQWVFSGIGVAIVGSIIGILFRRRQNNELIQKSKKTEHSVILQAGGDINYKEDKPFYSKEIQSESEKTIDVHRDKIESQVGSMELGHSIFLYGAVGDIPEAKQHIPNGAIPLLIAHIRELALGLELALHKNENHHEMLEHYKGQLNPELKHFFSIGFQTAFLQSASEMLRNRESRNLFEEYKKQSKELELKLIEYNIDKCMQFLPEVKKIEKKVLIEGSFDHFVSRMKAAIRGQ